MSPEAELREPFAVSVTQELGHGWERVGNSETNEGCQLLPVICAARRVLMMRSFDDANDVRRETVALMLLQNKFQSDRRAAFVPICGSNFQFP